MTDNDPLLDMLFEINESLDSIKDVLVWIKDGINEGMNDSVVGVLADIVKEMRFANESRR